MGKRTSKSISGDSILDETLDLRPLALLSGRQNEFPSGIIMNQFSTTALFCRVNLGMLQY